MNILIADDEPPARERLVTLLGEIRPGVPIVETQDGFGALEAIHAQAFDLVFLDIRMPGIDGLEVARHINTLVADAPAVIFTTAYERFALKAFDLGAIAYLVKPVRLEALEAALARSVRWNPALAWPASDPAKHARKFLVARSAGELRTVAVAAVSYFEAQEKYVRAVHPEGQLLLNESLAAIEEEFGDRFLRIHRSYLVAVEAIGRLVHEPATGERFVEMRDTHARIPVSRRLVPVLRRRILGQD
ncbi:alginate biosynthesis regulatory protein AlgR [mine drainage metagenome]|uniref:Alginate biosynthesis regulatory protein AlgR n=2 Tax=mine drainage metagenome TaxID=410659 RepID=T1BQ34_9ZZZZ